MPPKKQTMVTTRRAAAKNIKKLAKNGDGSHDGLDNESKQIGSAKKSGDEEQSHRQKLIPKAHRAKSKERKSVTKGGTRSDKDKSGMVTVITHKDGNEFVMQVTKEQDEEFLSDPEQDLENSDVDTDNDEEAEFSASQHGTRNESVTAGSSSESKQSVMSMQSEGGRCSSDQSNCDGGVPPRKRSKRKKKSNTQ